VKKITSALESKSMAKKMKNFSIKNHYGTVIVLSILVILLAASCQSSEPQETEVPTLKQEETEVLESPEPAPETEEMTEVETAEVNQCLVCHTDQDTLMDVADPVVHLESESSGEG
jgi:hypothetical protein